MARACARLGSDTTRTVAKGLYNPFRSLTDSSGYSEGPVEEPKASQAPCRCLRIIAKKTPQ